MAAPARATQPSEARAAADRFVAIYDEQLPRVLAYFVYRTPSRAEAEDLTQSTFERAYRAFARYDPRRGSVSTWLFTIAQSVLVDHHRRAAVRPVDPVAPEDLEQLEAGDDHASPGLDPALMRAIGRLRPRDQQVLALRYGADLTGPEISELLGLSLANVQQILSRSLRRLRSELSA